MIDCRAATKSYASQPVLRGIDLVVEPGICALLGAQRCWQVSTLLRLLSGLEEPDSGLRCSSAGWVSGIMELEFGGIWVYYPEGLGLFGVFDCHRKPDGNWTHLWTHEKSETATRAADLLGLLDLIQGRHTVARNCSFGMRKKTALAMALLHKPKVLLLDEPFEGIDPASSAVIQMLLGQLSLLMWRYDLAHLSHSGSVVQKIATRVVILYDGRVESDFNPSTTEAGVEEVYFSIVGKPQPEVADWLRS